MKATDIWKFKHTLWSLKPIAYIAGGIACAWMAAKSAYNVGAYEGVRATMETSVKKPEVFEEMKEKCIEFNEIED